MSGGLMRFEQELGRMKMKVLWYNLKRRKPYKEVLKWNYILFILQ